MKKLIIAALIAFISVSTYSEHAWNVDKWRISTYKDTVFIMQVNNKIYGKDYVLSKMVGNYRVYNSFIFVHDNDCDYLATKLDCKVLSELIIKDKYNDRLALIKYNKNKDKQYAIVCCEFNKKWKPEKTTVVVEFNRTEFTTNTTITNTVKTVVYKTNDIQQVETDLNNINFKFHKGISYE